MWRNPHRSSLLFILRFLGAHYPARSGMWLLRFPPPVKPQSVNRAGLFSGAAIRQPDYMPYRHEITIPKAAKLPCRFQGCSMAVYSNTNLKESINYIKIIYKKNLTDLRYGCIVKLVDAMDQTIPDHPVCHVKQTASESPRLPEDRSQPETII